MTTTMERPDEQLEDVTIEKEMRSSYLSYAMSVIVSRALPDVRDGLKPVHRRILYAMHEMNIRPSGQHRKCARIVGEVLGKFHPHGDGSVYDALVRMAQPFSMRVPLVDGQGNFGSIDGDPAAAMRYTEARMAQMADEMLGDIDEETVDRRANFDDSLEEPVVLPAKMPNLLVNGSTGIAVGMATNMPPHCPAEVCAAICALIDKPDASVDDLMQHIQGPDFPTAGIIRGRKGIRDIYANGRGRVVVEAVTSIEDGRNGRDRIVVTELPYQVNKANLVEKIAGLVKDKTVTGVSEIRDESDRRGIRVVLELSRGAQPRVILNNLYRRTALRTGFSAIMLALVDGQPQELPLRSLLEHFIAHRSEVIRRRSEFRLRRARDRAHILEGLLGALDAIDEIIAAIRGSDDVEEARNTLMEAFNLSERQAQAILDMQLRRLAALERQKLEAEKAELEATIRDLEQLLGDEARVREVIKEETRQMGEKYGGTRRTRIDDEEVTEQSYQDLVVEEDVVITLSQRGYIKRLPVNTYRNQRRGGTGVRAGDSHNADALMQVEVLSTHDRLLFFTNQGRVYPLHVHQLASDSSRQSRGTLAVNLIGLQDSERVQTMLPMRNRDTRPLLILATRQGKVKALELGELDHLTAKGMRVTVLADGDELVAVRAANTEHEILMVTKDGLAITFPVTEVRPQKRGATGMAGMMLRDGDEVVASEIIEDPNDAHIVVVSEGGLAKATPVYNNRGERIYPLSRRRRMGVKTFTAETNRKSRRYTGAVVDARVVSAKAMAGEDGDQVFIISEQGQVTRINLTDIKVMNTRTTRGVIVWRERSADDRVVSMACFKGEDEEPLNTDDDDEPPNQEAPGDDDPGDNSPPDDDGPTDASDQSSDGEPGESKRDMEPPATEEPEPAEVANDAAIAEDEPAQETDPPEPARDTEDSGLMARLF